MRKLQRLPHWLMRLPHRVRLDLIAYQRNALDIANAAREQMAIAYEQQRQLNIQKDEFLLNMEHELRTPLTEVHGYLELLRDHNGQLDPTTQLTFINNAVRGCEELLLLIGNIQDALKAGKSLQPRQMEALRVQQLVKAVLEHFGPSITQGYSIQIDIPEDLCIWAEPQAAQQILRNLLSNAFKYTFPATCVLITAQEIKDAIPQQVCISIKDMGPGIPTEEMPLLFNRGVRLKRHLSGPIRGSGLGLYISRQLVENMGGKLWAESSGIEGEGSCFKLTLPAVPPPNELENI